jgi:hypothetical protein
MRRSWWILGVALAVIIVALAARAVRSSPQPPTHPVVPMRFAPAPRREFSESDAITRLRVYLVSYDPYDVPRDCLNVLSNGYGDGGYALEVVDHCAAQPRTLGRWRVDAVTHAVSHQRAPARR